MPEHHTTTERPAAPQRRTLTQAEIDAAIQEWNGNIESKHAVVRYMKDHAREKDTAAWLRQEFGDDLPAFPVTVDGAAGDVSWPKVQRRIAQLIKEDRFYTQEEQDRFDNIDPIAIREALAERGIVNGQVAEPEKLDSDPFIQQVMRDVEQIAAEAPSVQPTPPDLSGQPITREGDTITIGNGEPTHEIDIAVSDEEYEAIQKTIPEEKVYDPIAPVYHEGDTVYLDNQEYQITELREDTVQLLPSGMTYPIFRAESRERFEQLLKNDLRNGAITEFLSDDPEKVDQDLREVLTSGLFTWQDKEYISRWLRDGEGNTRIAQRLSKLYSGRVETMDLATGDIADYRTFTTSIEIEVLDHDERKLATLAYRWGELTPLLRGLYVKEQDGFFQAPEGFADRHTPPLEGTLSYQVGDQVTLPAPDHPITGTIDAIEDNSVRIYTGPYAWSYDVVSREQFEIWLRQDERNAGLFTPDTRETSAPKITSEPVTVYPGDKNGLPYDVVVERLRVDEPEPTPPQSHPPENFRILDDDLGIGGPKEKFWRNIKAIATLKQIEQENRYATPEEQHLLSQYVGWGGLADAFDPDKPAWSAEYSELKELLTPEEYAAARASTLNAHYTSPTVIRAIYEAVEQMGFRTGNILEPSMGVGNFFGMLPESMAGSRLYGVELDSSSSGRIARQLYPKADITVAGFETTDRRDFYDLAIGNVPFGQYQVNDKAYNKLGFNIHNYFLCQGAGPGAPRRRGGFCHHPLHNGRQGFHRAPVSGPAGRAAGGHPPAQQRLQGQCRDRSGLRHPLPAKAGPARWTSRRTGPRPAGPRTASRSTSIFIDHPEMVLGRPTAESTQYGKQDYTVAPIEGLELADQLHDAVKYIRGTYQEAELPELGEGEDIDDIPSR